MRSYNSSGSTLKTMAAVFITGVADCEKAKGADENRHRDKSDAQTRRELQRQEVYGDEWQHR
jgi:hypothetical protein